MRRYLVVLAVASIAIAALGVGAWVTNAVGAPGDEPLTAVRYSISIDGIEIAAFSELTLLKSSVEIQPVQTNSKNAQTQVVPIKQAPTITLRRGLTNGMEVWAWHQLVLAGNMAAARKSFTLVAYNAEGVPVAKWFVENGFPAKLELAGLKAGGSEVLMETVTLVGETVQRVAP